MKDKICLVTGATDGIGKVTAITLARMGATVVGVGRNAQKTAAVTQEIKQATGNQNVDFLVADLSQVRQVRQGAAAFQRRDPRPVSYTHLPTHETALAIVCRLLL